MKATQAVNLSINTLSGNAGIYFGNQNVIIGVSNHSKSQNAVGSIGGHTHFHHNTNIIYDPDVIDTPIDDRDVHVYAPHYDHSAPNLMNAQVNEIRTETITQNAGVFIGDTTITGFDSHEKDNYAVGPVYGDQNLSQQNVNVIYDEDFLDTPIDDRDVKSGVFFNANA